MPYQHFLCFLQSAQKEYNGPYRYLACNKIYKNGYFCMSAMHLGMNDSIALIVSLVGKKS